MPILVVTFVGGVAVIFGAYWLLIGRPESSETQKLRRRLTAEDPARAQGDGPVTLLKEEQKLSTIGVFDAALDQSGSFAVAASTLVASSGLPITAGTFVLATGVLPLVVGLAVNLYLHVWWVALPVAAASMFIPYAVLAFFRNRRVLKFEEQFPEAIELIARAMRAGHAFATGIRMAAEELQAPAGPEFRLLYERQNYGAQMPDALRHFAERVPTIDARFFVTAVLTQREAGGNLAEILDRLAAVMRERFRIRREVRVRSAHGRSTAYVLAAMPPLLGLVMLFVNPAQMQILFTDPMGIRIVIGAVLLQVAGTLLVRRIVDIRY